MLFSWDPDKRETNLARHKLDLLDGQILFDGRPVITFPSPRNTEMRFVSTEQIGPKFYTVVWMERATTTRLISFRRARNGEERAYHARFGW